MNIVYNASEVASLINKNPYKSQEESVEDVICRIKKQKNTSSLFNNKNYTKNLEKAYFEAYDKFTNQNSDNIDIDKIKRNFHHFL